MSSSVASATDVATLDAILHALYEVISGPAGKPRDWDRFRSLFLPGGRLMPVVSIPEGRPYVRLLSPEEYVRRVEPIFATEDFWEHESSRQVETFGQVAHVLSHYESLRSPMARRLNAAPTAYNFSMTDCGGGLSASCGTLRAAVSLSIIPEELLVYLSRG